MNIDYENLRRDLVNYFGTAMSFNPMAIMNLSEVESATNERLVEIALNNNFDLNDYVLKVK